MKNLFILLIVSVSLAFLSCSSPRNKMAEQIALMESELKTVHKVDTGSVSELISAYQNFAARYAQDSLSPEFLYRAAGLANGFRRGTQSIDLYESIINTYPDFKRIPECYFMEAFVFENEQGNIGKAYECYSKFLDKYPDHDLADDARAALKYLGKTPDEMVREFEKNNPDSLKAVPQ